MEAEPIRFFVEEFMELMDTARKALGGFLSCNWQDFAPIPNATIAVATVLDSLVDSGRIAPGDELLINEHEYPACQNNFRRAARRAGAKVVTASLPFPCESPAAAADALMDRVTSKTRLVLLSHVTSPTGIILPVESLVRELNSRGIHTLVDGAHAPGMVESLNLGTLGAAFYTANCHKWICSPKGSAFLYVREDLQAEVRPLALSNNAEKPKAGRSQFLTEFDFQGTADYTAFMAIPKAIEFMSSLLPGGFIEVMRRNHALCIEGRNIVCSELGIKPTAPDSMLGSICTMILPPHDEATRARIMLRPSRYHDAIQDEMLRKYRIQVPFWGLAGKPERFLRISAQVYNSVEQYRYLAGAVKDLLAAERKA
jgi:isopenicillin-N epimerase